MNKDTPVLPIAGGFLKPLQEAHVHEGYVRGLNDHEVNRYLDGVKKEPQTRETVLSFIRSNIDSPSSVLFGIWRDDQRDHVGTVRLHGIDLYHRLAYIGICIFDRAAWGQGLGTRAVIAVTEWAVRELGLRWVEAGVYADNAASEKIFRNAGYELVYEVPDKFLLDGKPAAIRVLASRGGAR